MSIMCDKAETHLEFFQLSKLLSFFLQYYKLFLPTKDPGRSKYNHTSMESLVDVEYKYIRVNIVFPFHKLQDAERTSHCPPPPSYVTYLVRLAETLMTSFRVGVARDVRPLELLWLARARRVNGFCTQSQ